MIYAHDLQFYIPKFDGTADGQALTDFAVDVGSDLTTLVNSNLTQSDNFFADSIVQMSNEELAHVESSSQSGTSLSLYRNLSASPTGTFNIFPISAAANSAYRSSNRVIGLESTSFMAGIDTYYLPGINGTGQAELEWIPSLSEISWKAPGDTEFGEAVTISGDGTYYAYAAPSGDFGVNRYIELDITEASLPAVDTTDTLTITRLQAATIPNTEGDQTAAGIVRYVLIPIKNNSATDSAIRLNAGAIVHVEASSDMDGSWDGTETPFTLTDTTGFPTASFWVYNETRDDCAYIRYRSGYKLYPTERVGVLRGKTAQTWLDSDVVSVWTDFDVAVAEPTADVYPADLSALTYSTGYDRATIGELGAGEISGICIRETVLDSAYPIDDLLSLVELSWLP